MKFRMQVTEPKAVDVTLTITMTLGEWERLKEQLRNENPAWHLSSEISKLVSHVKEHFEATKENAA